MNTTTITQEGSTKTYKNHYGWTTESYFKIEGGPNSGRYVKVHTSKGSSGWISSHAQVLTVEKPTPGRFGGESFLMFGDPSMRLGFGVKDRSTEKTCAAQHQIALKILLETPTDWINGEK